MAVIARFLIDTSAAARMRLSGVAERLEPLINGDWWPRAQAWMPTVCVVWCPRGDLDTVKWEPSHQRRARWGNSLRRKVDLRPGEQPPEEVQRGPTRNGGGVLGVQSAVDEPGERFGRELDVR